MTALLAGEHGRDPVNDSSALLELEAHGNQLRSTDLS